MNWLRSFRMPSSEWPSRSQCSISPSLAFAISSERASGTVSQSSSRRRRFRPRPWPFFCRPSGLQGHRDLVASSDYLESAIRGMLLFFTPLSYHEMLPSEFEYLAEWWWISDILPLILGWTLLRKYSQTSSDSPNPQPQFQTVVLISEGVITSIFRSFLPFLSRSPIFAPGNQPSESKSL